MSSYDPSIDQANNPNAGQLPQVNSTSSTTPAYASYNSGGSQLANGNGTTIGVNNMPASTSTTTSAVPGTGTYAPAAAAQAAGGPIDVGYNGNVPGMGENVSAAFLGQYAQNGTPSTTQNAQGAYSQFQQSTPANMDPYYDNASRNSANAINTQMAARGSYGSSNAVGVLSNAETNLRAQQAKDEAGYGLSRAGLGGTLASSADQSSLANSTNERNWMSGLSDLAFQNQKQGMDRYQQHADNTFRGAQAGAGIEQRTGTAAIDAQQNLLVQTLMAQSGMSFDQATAAANQYNQQKTDSNQTTQDLTQGVTGLSKYYNA